MAGFAFSLWGLMGFWNSGWIDLQKCLKDDFKVTINGLDQLSFWMFIVVVVGNSLVCAWGFREKIRICYNCINQINNCPAWTIKLFLKSITTIIIVAAVLAVLALMVLCVGMFTLFWSIETVCKISVASVRDMLQQLGTVDNNITNDAICGFATRAKDAALKCTEAQMILVIGQIIVLAYWMKYSTLALADPYFKEDGGDLSEKDFGDVEIPEASTSESQKAPRKF